MPSAAGAPICKALGRQFAEAMTKINLPSLVPDAAWQGEPPDPLDDPELYDGVIWRRSLGYLIDLALIVAAGICLWILLGLLSVLTFGLLLPLKVAALALLAREIET